MRIRVVRAIGVLILVSATVTLARQQSGVQRGGQPAEKANLRSRVIKINADLDLLQLEHEADKAHMLGVMKALRDFEAMSEKQLIEATNLSMFFHIQDGAREVAREEALRKKLEAARPGELDRVSQEIDREREEGKKQDIKNTINSQVNAAKAYIESRKKEYLRRAADIADKRIELAEAEKQFNNTR